MGVIEDLKMEVFNYPHTRVDVHIRSFTMVSPGGLNVTDVFKFRIRIVNKGCLLMTNVKLAANGTDYAKVGNSPSGPFGYMATTSGVFSVDAWGAYETGWFYGKAKKETPGEKLIVTARLSEWDASLNYILNSWSMAGPKEGRLEKEVHPI